MTDAARLRVVGGAAVLAGVAAAATFYGTRERAFPPSAPAIRPVSPAPNPAPAVEAPRRESAEPAATAPAPARPESRTRAARAEPPRFDVVRMGARGTVVVAGRAAPGAEVVLYEGGREIGRARADARGEWVILPADPLGAGARELSLRARLPGGEELAGPDTVLVVGPPPAVPAIAEGPAREATPDGRAEPMAAAARQGEPRDSSRERSLDKAPEGPLVLLLPPTAAAAPQALSAPAANASGSTGGNPVALGLDVVDYDDGDTMRFAGTAPPGARLRVYSDDRHLGDAAAGMDGRWSLTPAEAPPVGRHTLRVDQLSTTGEAAPVAGRIEVAFQREALPAGLVRDGRVVVQPGHNLWRIARDSYGRGIRYTVIYRANQAQIRHPARIYPGQVFAVPEPR